MNLRYLFLAVVMLAAGLFPSQPQQDPVLFIGEPCSCMESICADCPQESKELIALLAEREYRWIVVFDPMENRQALARHLVRTQPQAQILLMEEWSLAQRYRMDCVTDCTAVQELIKKDRDEGWKNGF